MSTLEGLKHSSAAKYGTYALIILWYVIYMAGTLLQTGISEVISNPPVTQIAGASAAFLVGLILVNWFYGSGSG